MLLNRFDFHPLSSSKNFHARRYTSNGISVSVQYKVEFVSEMPVAGFFDDTTTILSDDINVTIHTNQNGLNHVKSFTYYGDIPSEFL